MKWFRRSAEQGHADAQYNLGLHCSTGEGCEKDMTEAAKWFRKAADQGVEDAKMWLANKDKPADKYAGTNLKDISKAAQAGDPGAQHNLGDRYYAGVGVEMNKQEAVKWWKKAAENGYAPAQMILGACYEKGGEGVDRDPIIAVKWYAKAADQGNANAQYFLGYHYKSAEGNHDQNLAEAAKWFREAAGQGIDLATVQLGEMCEDGQGTEKNLVEAYAWYALSSKKYRCESLKSIMSKEQLEEGKKRAKALQEQINARMKNGK